MNSQKRPAETGEVGIAKRLRKERVAVWTKSKDKKKYCALNGKLFEGREAFEEYRRDKVLLERFPPEERKRITQSNGISRKQLRQRLREQGNSSLLDQSIELKECDESLPPDDLRRWVSPEIGIEYAKHGYTRLHNWQQQLLSENEEELLLRNKNLLIFAPTGSGKSLVAEIIAIRAVMRHKKVLIACPFRSIVAEKAEDLSRILQSTRLPLPLRIASYIGGAPDDGAMDMKGVDIAVATYEKANGIVNTLFRTGNIASLGVAVVDEIHMVSEPKRGPGLETLTAKLLAASVQVVALSATIKHGSRKVLQQWLDAVLYETEERPNTLDEWIVVGKSMLDRTMTRNTPVVPVPVAKESFDESFLLPDVCWPVLNEGGLVLVFCPRRHGTFHAAERTAKYLPASYRDQHSKERQMLVNSLQQLSTPPPRTLLSLLRVGVAYHHAGLEERVRRAIEDAYRRGIVRLICATRTLAAGVNLPASRVVIRSCGDWQSNIKISGPLDTTSYKQMIGRAGRNRNGDSVLLLDLDLQRCCAKRRSLVAQFRTLVRHRLHKDASAIEEEINIIPTDLRNLADTVATLLQNELPTVRSQLADDALTVEKACLEVVASGISRSITSCSDALKRFFLLPFTKDISTVQGSVEEAFHRLFENCFIFHTPSSAELAEALEMKQKGMLPKPNPYEPCRLIVPTQLGLAAFASSLPPHDALFLYKDLSRVQMQGVCLSCDLHLLYLCVPLHGVVTVRLPQFFALKTVIQSSSREVQHVASLCGVTPSATPADFQNYKLKYQRFFEACVLFRVLQRQELPAILRDFAIEEQERQELQKLKHEAAAFAGVVVRYCEQLNWHCLVDLLKPLVDRLQCALKPQLQNLVRVVKQEYEALALYRAGIRTISELADSTPSRVLHALTNDHGYNRRADALVAEIENSSGIEAELRQKRILVESRRIIARAQVTLLEKRTETSKDPAGPLPRHDLVPEPVEDTIRDLHSWSACSVEADPVPPTADFEIVSKVGQSSPIHSAEAASPSPVDADDNDDVSEAEGILWELTRLTPVV